jgi:hypothetical protein
MDGTALADRFPAAYGGSGFSIIWFTSKRLDLRHYSANDMGSIGFVFRLTDGG